jgi:hypothetical protein
MALCEALRITKETMAAVDGRILRNATCDFVHGLKTDGLPIGRIVARVKTLAREAGFSVSTSEPARPGDDHLGILLDEVLRICVEEYYR